MTKPIKYFIALAIATTFFSCNNVVNQKVNDINTTAYKELEKASWLIGEWENKSKEGIASEIWVKINDSCFYGRSNFIIGNDTVSSETINLVQNADKLYYIPTIKDQNNGQSVKFVLTASTKNKLVFENPEHDFPQKISYNQITKDSLLAEISGIINGKLNSQQFPMSRLK